MIKTLILVGGKEKFHDVLSAAQVIQKILIENNILARYSQDFSILSEKRIDEFDAVIFYTQGKDLTIAEQEGLKNYIKQGNIFIPLHAANIFDESQHEIYKKIIGSKFINHDPFKRFQVNIVKDHFITENIDNFEVDDELYESKLFYEPDNILAWAKNNGEKHPMLYTKKIGKGEICYFALGHDGRAWYNPSFKRLLCRIVNWSKQL